MKQSQKHSLDQEKELLLSTPRRYGAPSVTLAILYKITSFRHQKVTLVQNNCSQFIWLQNEL